MLKGFTHARLACGCRLAFREGVEGSPVTVIVDEKSPACTLALHVRDLPIFDYREADLGVEYSTKRLIAWSIPVMFRARTLARCPLELQELWMPNARRTEQTNLNGHLEG